jgi:hypothetical protein
MKRLLGWMVLALALLSCEKQTDTPKRVEKAELGIFFGGQVQERDQIPFTLDRAKQTQGFRIQFREPLPKTARVHWEIDQPGPRSKSRIARLGETQARAGMEQLDQELEFKPGDPLGVWNIRVLVDDELVIDRPILVFDMSERKKARIAGLSGAAPQEHNPHAERGPKPSARYLREPSK